MADNINIDRVNEVYAYDPSASTDLSPFAVISGTPTVTSNVIRLNAATLQTRAVFSFGEAIFQATVPAAPTGGDARIWGFRSAGWTTYGSAYFEVTGAVFRAVSYDDNGTAETTNITWSASWTNTSTEYRIIWDEDGVKFYVGDSLKATHRVRQGRAPQALYARNANADNMDLTFLMVRNAGHILSPSNSYTGGQTSNSTSVGGVQNSLPLARYNATPTARTEGQFGNLQADANGSMNVNLATTLSGEDQTNLIFRTAEAPLAVSTYTPDLDTSAAAEASSVTKASAGVLYGVTFSNANAATRFLQFFNSTTVPADTAVPVIVMQAPTATTLSVTWPMGRYFSTGIAWCNSSTQNTKTVGAADSLADVRYK